MSIFVDPDTVQTKAVYELIHTKTPLNEDNPFYELIKTTKKPTKYYYRRRQSESKGTFHLSADIARVKLGEKRKPGDEYERDEIRRRINPNTVFLHAAIGSREFETPQQLFNALKKRQNLNLMWGSIGSFHRPTG